jgi:hypothetical protein
MCNTSRTPDVIVRDTVRVLISYRRILFHGRLQAPCVSLSGIATCSITRDGVWIGHWIFECLQLLAKINFNRFTNSHILQFPKACAKSSTSSLGFATQRLPTEGFLRLSHLRQRTAVSVKVKVKVILRPTVSRPVCLGTKHPFWAYDQIFIACVTVTVWFLWGALYDERSGLSFICASGPCQRSLSRVQVPWDSRPYFTVSDLRLPFSSPPTTRRVTVEVFDPASTRVLLSYSALFWSVLSLV